MKERERERERERESERERERERRYSPYLLFVIDVILSNRFFANNATWNGTPIVIDRYIEFVRSACSYE